MSRRMTAKERAVVLRTTCGHVDEPVAITYFVAGYVHRDCVSCQQSHAPRV